jgi:integral membrane protein (TIGR01906 family)
MIYVNKTLKWIVTILIPVLLILASIRILLTPLFLEMEYRLPGFPADSYGFTMDERLKWSKVAVEYLLNDANISYLGDLTFPDGSPLFIQRELSHMLDVKILVQQVLTVFYLLIGVVLIIGLLAWRTNWISDYWSAVSRGGWLTIFLILAVLVLVILNFNLIFTGFHRIFFQGDTWIFLYSDTLIRLFPIRFWQVVFISLGVTSILSSLVLGLLGRKLSRG